MSPTSPQEALFAAALDTELSELRELLVAKNREYGNAALDPTPVFSHATPEERLYARLDEKLARVRVATSRREPPGGDTVLDLLGCLVLLRLAGRRACRG